MSAMRCCLVLVLWLSVTVAAPAQGRKSKKPELGFKGAKARQVEDVDIEFKVPKGFRLSKQKLPEHFKAVFNGPYASIVLMTTRASSLEQAREGFSKDIESKNPGVNIRIQRGRQYGGMNCISLVLDGMKTGTLDYWYFNIVDVPVQGIMLLEVRGSSKLKDMADKLNAWLMPTFRLTGEEGDELLFTQRTVHKASGLSYRVTKGAVATPDTVADVVFEGSVPGGVHVKIERVSDADGSPKTLLKQWAGGAKVEIDPTAVETQLPDTKAVCALFGEYGGRPKQALGVFPVDPTKTFRIRVAGGTQPLLELERIASTLEWLDIASLETEVAGWLPKVAAAIKAKDERQLKRYGRKAADRYYLKASQDVARAILKGGPEAAQVRALECIGRGGDPLVDLKTVRWALSNSKFKKLTKMRVKAAQALGLLEDISTTNYLMRVMADKDAKVAKAAVVALGKHKANRKKSIPKLLREWKNVIKMAKSKDSKKRLRASRLGDACRDALRELTGDAGIKEHDDAKKWLSANRKMLGKEQLKDLKKAAKAKAGG